MNQLASSFDSDSERVRPTAVQWLEAPTPTPDALKVGNVVLEPQLRLARQGDQTIRLAPTCFALLWVLARSPNRALSYARLLRLVLGCGANSEAERVRLRLHIMRLRRVIEDYNIAGLELVNRECFGYMLRVAADGTSIDPSSTTRRLSRRSSRLRALESNDDEQNFVPPRRGRIANHFSI